MNADRESVLRLYPGAVVVTWERDGRTEYRVSTPGRYLGRWCGSEVRAWEAAARAVADRANDGIS